jgi:hypothetical protein
MQREAMETARHRRLKELALAWAGAAGWTLGRFEVRVPRSGFRADVGAAGGATGSPVILFECKQARADWRRDVHSEPVVRADLASLSERRSRLEALLALHWPELRRGEALWAEYDSYDFQALRHDGYRNVVARQAAAGRRLREGTKFSRMHRYQCADHLYLVIEDGISAPAEIPAGWGVLVRSGDTLQLGRAAPLLVPDPRQREALRAEIAGRVPPDCTSPEIPELFAHA